MFKYKLTKRNNFHDNNNWRYSARMWSTMIMQTTFPLVHEIRGIDVHQSFSFVLLTIHDTLQFVGDNYTRNKYNNVTILLFTDDLWRNKVHKEKLQRILRIRNQFMYLNPLSKVKPRWTRCSVFIAANVQFFKLLYHYLKYRSTRWLLNI